ncbi:hypothetical protein JCM14108_515 [Lentilactobacillus farraginis DSM 18382 = JCM 14108]|uniref:Uncharacterized protein n=2 Tax=Lentilactobacillus farraginis DSM 18382 = JCM 14108 TaxID=1423743 RepID=X0QAJ3_9LACO|nr:hypothetical protein [Lentilactobacillus farraginis]GAF35620.1 hypothetical protein JCM14108_515 [Lentilactobacillus farraginis DSM 18382 = JCM 14108]
MMNQEKLTAVVKTFARYNVKIKTRGMRLTAINEEPVDFDANTYMQDQLIELICKVLANQLIKAVWQREHPTI